MGGGQEASSEAPAQLEGWGLGPGTKAHQPVQAGRQSVKGLIPPPPTQRSSLFFLFPKAEQEKEKKERGQGRRGGTPVI